MPAQKTKAEEQKTLDIAHIQKVLRVARFKGTTMYMADDGYWKPLAEDYFRTRAYAILSTPMRSRINEVWDYMQLGTPWVILCGIRKRLSLLSK
jgi:hypothetical protein